MQIIKNNTFLLTFFLIFFISENSFAGRCSGTSGCSACTTCSSCKHCNRDGGSCGVCGGGFDSVNKNSDEKVGNGVGKFALVGGGAYLLYSLFKKKSEK